MSAFPKPGESVAATNFSIETGGKGLNVAIGARRLGCQTHCMLAVGNDFFSALAEGALVRNEISPALIRRYATATGAGIGFIRDEGENCVAVYPGANFCLSGEDVQHAASLIQQAAIVVAQYEIADAPIRAAFQIARSAGRPTLLNPSPFRPIAPDLLADTSILVVNESEAEALAITLGTTTSACDGIHDRFATLAGRLTSPDLEALVVTLGAEGAVAHLNDGRVLFQGSFAVDVVDTLGAGDAFTAAFAAGLAHDLPFVDAMRRAAGCGALMVSRHGTINALPRREELDRFLKMAP